MLVLQNAGMVTDGCNCNGNKRGCGGDSRGLNSKMRYGCLWRTVTGIGKKPEEKHNMTR